MIDANSFLLMVLYILGGVLLVVLIILSTRLLKTITKIDNIIDELEIRLSKFDKVVGTVDVITDSMALFSDKIVEAIWGVVRKVFIKNKDKENGKEDEKNEKR